MAMTWKRLKEEIEAMGVTDETLIGSIDLDIGNGDTELGLGYTDDQPIGTPITSASVAHIDNFG